MIAKITSGNNMFGALSYNYDKVSQGEAAVISSNLYENNPRNIKEAMDLMDVYLRANQRTKNTVFHVSLNPNVNDKLSLAEIKDMAADYMKQMGYGDQPYIVFQHKDIDRDHIHIVSCRTDVNGKRIARDFERWESKKVVKNLEVKYNLIPLTQKEEREEKKIKKVDYKEGDIANNIRYTALKILETYKFSSMEEYRLLLKAFNIDVQETKFANGKIGITYAATNKDGQIASSTIAASKLSNKITHVGLVDKFKNSKRYFAYNRSGIDTIKDKILKAMSEAKTEKDFIYKLNKSYINVQFNKNSDGRIYGVTYIDNFSKNVLKGSDIAKEVSANPINDLANTTWKDNEAKQFDKWFDYQMSKDDYQHNWVKPSENILLTILRTFLYTSPYSRRTTARKKTRYGKR